MSDGNPNDQTATPPAEPKVEPTDPNSLFADQLATIQAPDGRQKFNSVEAAIASIPHAQTHIDTQAQRIRELEQQVEQAKGVDAILETLQQQTAQPAAEPAQAGVPDVATVAQIVEQQLGQRDIEARQTANSSQVLGKLTEQYGDKAEARFNEKAASLGMTVGQLSTMARETPQAALALFTEVPAAPANPTTSSVNAESMGAQRPAEDPKPDIFNGGLSPNIKSWRAAAPTQ